MMRVHARGRSDVGRVRRANEDAYHVGDSVFAVADGMGGHVAGEVASSTALEPIAALDGRVFSDAQAARTALRTAVLTANEAVVSKAAGDPEFEGMGTTLTAVMVEGRRAHMAHVGDSRAYLFRDNQFGQLTTDHTLVQRMIDEGRLTREEAANHPQRSIITRAIGVEAEIDVDAMSLDLLPGDVLVLCSDGLTGPVDDQTITRVLADRTPSTEDDASGIDEVAQQLIDAANDAGGPDNITVVVLEFEELPTAPAPKRTSPGPVVVSTAPDTHEDDWAGSLGRFGNLGGTRGITLSDEDGDHHARRGPSRSRRIAAAIVVVGLLLGASVAGGRWVLSRSWFVGVDEGQVVIYQGVPASVGPLELSWEWRRTEVSTDGLPGWVITSLEEGVPATSASDAAAQVDNYRRLAENEGE